MYGLYFDKQITLDRILIITTTRRGAAQAENQLLLAKMESQGLGTAMFDYGLPPIPFSKKTFLWCREMASLWTMLAV